MALRSWRGADGELLNQDRVSVALLLSGRRAGQSRALTPGPGQWRGRWLGLRLGQGGWSLCSGGDVGGRGRGGGGAGTTLCAAAIYGRGEERIIHRKGKVKTR